MSWPDDARFAFTIVDDTDGATLANGPPVYDALTDAGLRITKTVWIDDSPAPLPVGGTSCADPDYLQWVLDLQRDGHEIGFHNARDFPSTRAETLAALDRFRQLFGHDPRIGADHAHNLEALYWGPRRLTGWRAQAYRAGAALARPGGDHFSGEVPGSDYFWGDLCRARVDYWRNFTFDAVNVLDPCPTLPYHDASRSYVNWWYAASDAPDFQTFIDMTSDEHLDHLEREGGACIIYTHLGLDFAPGGTVDPRLLDALGRITSRRGWFAPASAVLDVLREANGGHLISDAERRRLELRWIAGRLRRRGRREARRTLHRLAGRHRSPAQRPGASARC